MKCAVILRELPPYITEEANGNYESKLKEKKRIIGAMAAMKKVRSISRLKARYDTSEKQGTILV